ncbi:MAG: ion transporter [Gammaproteobacteria bacterium]|nr:ion transporter [Gammaproteobacteria bacterium]
MPLFQSVKTIIEDISSPGGRVFGFCIQTLIIISIISFSMETLPNLSQGTHDLLRVIEIVTVAIFSVEYMLRIVVADKKSGFIFSFYGVVDLIAILPFYLTVGLDLRTLRIFRLLRLLRLLKLARYSRALDRMYRAFQLVRTDLALCMMAAMVFVYLSAVGIYYFENPAQPEQFKSVFHSLWWAVATLTTVGYGDIYPVTVGGRIFTFVILMIGLGIITIPTGIMAAAMTRVSQEDQADTDDK